MAFLKRDLQRPVTDNIEELAGFLLWIIGLSQKDRVGVVHIDEHSFSSMCIHKGKLLLTLTGTARFL